VAEGPCGSPVLGDGLPGILMRNGCLTKQIGQERALREGGGVLSWRVAKVRLSEGGRGKMAVQKSTQSVHAVLREGRRPSRSRFQNAN